MDCDYYTDKELVIIYIGKDGKISTTITNRTTERHYVQDSDNFNEELQKLIKKYTYEKKIYENDTWIEETYKNKYLKKIKYLIPEIVKLIKIYKNVRSYEKI